MMIKAVIFDFDDMLIHAEMFSTQYSNEFGIPIEEMLPFFKGVFKECIIGKKDTKQELKPFLEKWNWKGSADELLNWWFEHEANIDNDMVQYIKDLKAKGIKCFLATNQERYKIEYFRDNKGFGQLFDEIFASSFIGAMKHTDEFFDKILETLDQEGIKPEETVQWDDEPAVLAKAREKGINAYEFRNNKEFFAMMKQDIG